MYPLFDRAQLKISLLNQRKHDLSISVIKKLPKRGSFGINKNSHESKTPIFSSKVIDTVGAGDAFFAFTAPCFARGMPMDLVSFIGNAVGALAVQIVCNKKPVEKQELFEFMSMLLK